MYRRIMTPVDMAHLSTLEKALSTTADLAKHYNVPVVFVGVTTTAPSAVAHNPEEFKVKLEGFAAEQANRHGIDASSLAIYSHDPAVDLDTALLDAIRDTDSDLVVMGSHVPGRIEHIFASNAGYIAMHAKVSVFVVR